MGSSVHHGGYVWLQLLQGVYHGRHAHHLKRSASRCCERDQPIRDAFGQTRGGCVVCYCGLHVDHLLPGFPRRKRTFRLAAGPRCRWYLRYVRRLLCLQHLQCGFETILLCFCQDCMIHENLGDSSTKLFHSGMQEKIKSITQSDQFQKKTPPVEEVELTEPLTKGAQ